MIWFMVNTSHGGPYQPSYQFQQNELILNDLKEEEKKSIHFSLIVNNLLCIFWHFSNTKEKSLSNANSQFIHMNSFGILIMANTMCLIKLSHMEMSNRFCFLFFALSTIESDRDGVLIIDPILVLTHSTLFESF